MTRPNSYIVVGANYGDEGKGLIVDYLTRKLQAEVVIRFNGGAQAGHTVQLPNGKRHVFRHFASGTLAGAMTYLSHHFICNPILYKDECMELNKIGVMDVPFILVHPHSQVTTIYDMFLNHAAEFVRAQRHGSCGVGINETVERSIYADFALSIGDCIRLGDEASIMRRLKIIGEEWVPMRLNELGIPSESPHYKQTVDLGRNPALRHNFYYDLQFMLRGMDIKGYDFLRTFKTPLLYEGAQGLALDQSSADFPHVTRSNTGIQNAMGVDAAAGMLNPNVIYVTRTYLTRHGAGPLPGELHDYTGMVDTTNGPHPFQGILRYAPLDEKAMSDRISKDLRHFLPNIGSAELAVTWCDMPLLGNTNATPYHELIEKAANILRVWLTSYGPTHEDVTELYSRG